MAITTNNLISRQTVGSAGAASVTFSNIPQTFTDLKIVSSARSTATSGSSYMQVSFNSSTTSFTLKALYGSGSSASSYSEANVARWVGSVNPTDYTASTFANMDLYIPNYASANYKSYSADTADENNNSSAEMLLIGGLWSNTAAITSITLSAASGSFTQYSTFSLYGISSNTSTQNTSVPSATGGDVITTDGTYWYHAFKYSGTFTPLKALTADVLMIAGGGGGGGGRGGGGGAGGLVYYAASSLTASDYSIGIGGGGAGAASQSVRSSNGADTTFTGKTAATGGGGAGSITGTSPEFNGRNGGSGGGAALSVASGPPYSSGTAGTGSQGTNGAAAYTGAEGYTGGGGGGYSVAGAVGGINQGGAGGNGTSAYSSWGSATSTGQNVSGTYYYAGGGGGGAYHAANSNAGISSVGGYGGGGAGGGNTNAQVGTAGTANTGGAGGGSDNNATSGPAGGSGLVIVRYAV